MAQRDDEEPTSDHSRRRVLPRRSLASHDTRLTLDV